MVLDKRNQDIDFEKVVAFQNLSKMHPFASGSSIVTLSKHAGGVTNAVTVSPNTGNTTLAFTDADGNVITPVADGSPPGNPGGVTIVTSDSLVGNHFLSGDQVAKLEIEDDVSQVPVSGMIGIKKEGCMVDS